MKSFLSFILLGLLPLVSSCTKENFENSKAANNSLVKLLQLEGSYFSRSIAELEDGSMVISSVSATTGPAYISRYALNGDFLWQIDLPNVIQKLWHTVLLNDGNIAAVGYGGGNDADECGIVILNVDGEILKQQSFYDLSEQVDCIQLANGNLAILTNGGRLLIFDLDLNQVFSKSYGGGSQGSLAEDPSGALYLQSYETSGFNFSSIIKLSPSNYELIYNQNLFYPVALSPSNLALSRDGQAIVASARFTTGRDANRYGNSGLFQPSNQEQYLTGPTLVIWQSDGVFANTKQIEISGFPKNAYIKKVKSCRDGGYILLGTCNINSIQTEYRVLLIKLSSSLEMEWMQVPKTNSPAIGDDIEEISTGYLISATHLSLNEAIRPIIFKTGFTGKIE
jgi:hypothetical protein